MAQDGGTFGASGGLEALPARVKALYRSRNGTIGRIRGGRGALRFFTVLP